MTTTSEPYASSAPSGSERYAEAEGARRSPPRMPSTKAGPIEGISNFAAAVAARIRRQPHVALAVAGAVGFVIGGALSFRAGRVVLAAAARQLGRELIHQSL